MLRPDARRWDPLVCTDATGAVVGITHLDAVMVALCDASSL